MNAAGAPSAVTAASQRFVAAHLERAGAIGDHLAELVADPDAFVSAIRAGMAEIADPAVVEGIHSVTPGLGMVMGVRLPLLEATHKHFRRATKAAPAAQLFEITDRLLSEQAADIRWFGMWNLERLLALDPDRSWELLRRAAAEAAEWISVDTLAHPFGAGILRDSVRWAELDRLVTSTCRWERRLVGSSLATLPHVKLPGARDTSVAIHGLALIGRLMGDPEPDVQKALSWAMRSLAAVDPAAVVAFVETETATAHATGDGYRAWVIRDALPKLPPANQATLRTVLAGIRRRPGAPSTSIAAATAAHSALSGAAAQPVHSTREG
jgi:3-methyladenine DNA glycosylase AlkD